MLELPEWSSKKSRRVMRPADQWTHCVFKHDVPGEWPHRRPAVNRGVRLARLAAQPALWALAALTVTNSKVCIQTPIAMRSSMSPAPPPSTQLGQLMTALTFLPLFLCISKMKVEASQKIFIDPSNSGSYSWQCRSVNFVCNTGNQTQR